MIEHELQAARPQAYAIEPNSSAPPVSIPAGHVGPVVIPGTGRMIWWTGRVAIGLRHQPVRFTESTAQSSLWIQRLLRAAPGSRQRGHQSPPA